MKSKLVFARIIIVILFIALGIAGFKKLSELKMEPELKETRELVISATGMQAQPVTEQVTIRGFGTARASQRAVLRAEVAGRVIEMDPGIENGKLVAQGQLLLRIEPESYQAAVDRAAAEVEAAKSRLAELTSRQENDTLRLEVIKRSRDLAQREFERIRKLVEEEKVEAPSRRDQAETVLVQQEDAVVSMQNALRLYPSQIQSARAQVKSAQALLAQAKLDLEKTNIVAPFAGRIENKGAELGETVGVMNELLTVVDDRVLEIEVPIEGGEIARWLDLTPDTDLRHWFGRLPDVDVDVRWTEQPDQIRWQGKLDRIQRYDEMNRTVILVVRVIGAVDSMASDPVPDAVASTGFPLLEGMFCRVGIPGKILNNVYNLPRTAVSHDGTLYVANDSRLRTRRVEVLRLEENRAIIGEGLNPGDLVLTSKPGIVLDGVKVELDLLDPESTDHWNRADSAGTRLISEDETTATRESILP